MEIVIEIQVVMQPKLTSSFLVDQESRTVRFMIFFGHIMVSVKPLNAMDFRGLNDIFS